MEWRLKRLSITFGVTEKGHHKTRPRSLNLGKELMAFFTMMAEHLIIFRGFNLLIAYETKQGSYPCVKMANRGTEIK